MLGMCLSHLKKLDRATQLFSRYIRVTRTTEQWSLKEETLATILTLNYLSRASVPYPSIPRLAAAKQASPTLFGVPGCVMIHVDLRKLAPRGADLDEVVKVWEEFQFDNELNLNLTHDTLKFAGLLNIEVPRTKRTVKKTVDKVVDVPPFKHTDGHTYRQKWVKETVLEVIEGPAFDEDTVVLRRPSPELDKALVAELVDLTQSQASVTSHGHLIFCGLSTIQDEDVVDGKKQPSVYSTVFGGKYNKLRFRNAGKSRTKGVTDEDQLLADLGIGNVVAKEDAEDFFTRVGSDQRAFKTRSVVSGGPRGCLFMPNPGTQPDAGQGLVIVTLDVKKGSIDLAKRAMLNLFQFGGKKVRADAKELIATNLWGLHLFGMFNGEGEQQDAVPTNVAWDYEAPRGERVDIEPHSCITCHGKKSGWQTFKSDAHRMIKNGLRVFGDLTAFESGLSQEEQLDRLAGQYKLDPELTVLPEGRANYSKAIMSVTGPWIGRGKGDQADIVQTSSACIGDIFAEQAYGLFDARRALKHLGIVAEKDAEAQFDKLLPPVQTLPPLVEPILPEDGRIAAIKSGAGVVATDFYLASAFMRARIARTRAVEKLKKAG